MNNNNKLIAEFMGAIEVKKDTYKFPNRTGLPLQINTINYHKDWNWLMEVVEKIESLNYSLEINKQEELDYQCLITQKNNIIIQKFNTIKIQAVYQAVVEFINQLNNN